MTGRTTPQSEKKPPGWKVEGVKKPESPPEEQPNLLRRPPNRRLLIIALVLFAVNWYLTSLFFARPEIELSYSQVLDAVEDARDARLGSNELAHRSKSDQRDSHQCFLWITTASLV